MARLTKKQEQLYKELIVLHHELIKSRFNNNRDEFNCVIEEIREVVKDDTEQK